MAIENDDIITGRLTVAFCKNMIGSSRGDISINREGGIIHTPYEWLNEIINEYQITHLERKYFVKNQEWNLSGVYLRFFYME
jgi:starvation-inducible outer membrane lipoprotein